MLTTFDEQVTAIIRNTFFESIRQPIVLVVLTISTIMLVLSNPLSAFTMDDDQRMMIDIGLATVFVAGTFLAAFVATGVLAREIENKTVLTVISKPVGRPLFVIGKFLGVSGALILCTLYLSFVFLLVEHHHVLMTVRDPIHVPVITFGTCATVIGVGAAIWCNYFYGKVFSSTVICFMTPLAGLAYLFSLMFRFDFTPVPISLGFEPDLWLGLGTLMVAILVLTAIAVATSTRLGQVTTICVTVGMFMIGLLSDWLFGRPVSGLKARWLERAEAQGLTTTEEFFREFEMTTGEVQRSVAAQTREVLNDGVALTDMAQGSEMLSYSFFTVCSSIVPNFQVLWLSDALTQGHRIPVGYVLMSSLYGLLYIVVALAIGIALFQRREVG